MTTKTPFLLIIESIEKLELAQKNLSKRIDNIELELS